MTLRVTFARDAFIDQRPRMAAPFPGGNEMISALIVTCCLGDIVIGSGPVETPSGIVASYQNADGAESVPAVLRFPIPLTLSGTLDTDMGTFTLDPQTIVLAPIGTTDLFTWPAIVPGTDEMCDLNGCIPATPTTTSDVLLSVDSTWVPDPLAIPGTVFAIGDVTQQSARIAAGVGDGIRGVFAWSVNGPTEEESSQTTIQSLAPAVYIERLDLERNEAGQVIDFTPVGNVGLMSLPLPAYEEDFEVNGARGRVIVPEPHGWKLMFVVAALMAITAITGAVKRGDEE